MSHERGFFAPKVSRISRAQMRRAARYLAISSKKSLWALQKKGRRGGEEADGAPPRPAGARGRGGRAGEGDGERERSLWRWGRAGLADVVAGDRDRVPARHLA